MSFEPSGKVATLFEAMRREPDRIWTSPEVAKAMDVHQGALTAHLDAAIRHGMLYRKLEAGRCQYSLKAFPITAPAASTPPSSGWTPPPMVPPRGTSAPIPSLMTAPRPPAPGSVLTLQPSAVTHTPPPRAKRPADQVEADAEPRPAETKPAAAETISPKAETTTPDALISMRTGEIVIIGIEPDDEGRVVVPKDLVQAIRRQIAWMPA